MTHEWHASSVAVLSDEPAEFAKQVSLLASAWGEYQKKVEATGCDWTGGFNITSGEARKEAMRKARGGRPKGSQTKPKGTPGFVQEPLNGWDEPRPHPDMEVVP
jgi:hypothetical protein